MKPTMLVHPSHARSVMSEDDAANLRRAGWLELEQAKPVSKMAAHQRNYRKRCRENGYRLLNVWLPESVHEALAACRRPGETIPQQLERLSRSLSLI